MPVYHRDVTSWEAKRSTRREAVVLGAQERNRDAREG